MNDLIIAPLRCDTYMHMKGSVGVRSMQVTRTMSLPLSFFATATNGFVAFNCFIRDCATGAAVSNPVTNTANLSESSCPAQTLKRQAVKTARTQPSFSCRKYDHYLPSPVG
jgi:hypothetical protein